MRSVQAEDYCLIIINFILTGIECIVDKLVTTVNCLVHLCYIAFVDIVIIMDMLMMFKDAVVKCYIVFTIIVFLVVKKLMKFLGKVIKHPYFVVSFGIWMMVDIVLDIFSVITRFSRRSKTHLSSLLICYHHLKTHILTHHFHLRGRFTLHTGCES